jgi:hypothetical protein
MACSMGSAHAAQLGQYYDSYRDLHRDTQYGSIFFNEGAIRKEESRSRKRFHEILGTGTLDLPKQEGYCFVFNHYGSSDSEDKQGNYRVSISWLFPGGKSFSQTIDLHFTPTSDVVSSALPDFCISRLVDAIRVKLQVRSNHAEFNRNIELALQ